MRECSGVMSSQMSGLDNMRWWVVDAASTHDLLSNQLETWGGGGGGLWEMPVIFIFFWFLN